MSHGETDRNEKAWLVKSSTRILGPYSVEEIAQLLAKKHISIIDEIRSPEVRWKYVREHAIFDEVVKQLRSEQENSPDLTQTQTQTQTQTHTATQNFDTKLTPTPTPSPMPPAHQIVDVQPTFLAKSDLELKMPPLPAAPASTKEASPWDTSAPGYDRRKRTFTSVAEPRISEQIVKSKTFARIAIAVVVVVLLIGFAIVRVMGNLKRDQGYATLMSEARLSRVLQLYDKSLAAYRQAAHIREPDIVAQTQMALILIVLDHQTTQGRRLLEKALSSDGGRDQSVEDLLGISISYILENNYKDAEETLQKVLIAEPSNFFAHMDLALIAIRKGEPKVADEMLADLTRKSQNQQGVSQYVPLLVLARSVAFLQNASVSASVDAAGLINEIHGILERTQQLRPELLLMNASLLPADGPQMKFVISQFLTQIVFGGGEYVRDLHLDWRVADWDFLQVYCKNLSDRLPASSHLKALRAICSARAGRDDESRVFIDDAVAADPHNPLVLMTQANLLYKNGLRNEAFAILRLPELADFPLHETLVGKICWDQGDYSCAQKSFEVALEKKTKDPTAKAGLAMVLQAQGHKGEASKLINSGLGEEPNFIPFLELREN